MPTWLIIVGTGVATLASLRMPGAPELRYAVATAILMIGSFILPGGRVLTVPFAFVLIIVLLFWSARRSAEREDEG
jgi:hypothetical protein